MFGFSLSLLRIPSCKYKASWLMATSAKSNIRPAYAPSHLLCLLCGELWVLGKRGINKCIVGATLRGGYSNNSSCLEGGSGPCLFTGAADCIIGELSTLTVPSGYLPSSTPLTFLRLSTSAHRGSAEARLVRTVWPSSLSLVQCKYSWSERSWWIWEIW